MTRALVAASVACLLALAAASPAQAQVSAKVLGGVTRAAGSEPFISGSLGVRTGFIEVEGEVGRMFDILPSGLLDRLNELQRENGLPVQAIAKMPATYAMGNLRIISPAGPVRPFGTVGVGIARVEPKFDVVVAGISLGDVFGLTSVEARTETMLMAGAGVRIDVGRSGLLEVGYRYLVLFADFDLESGLTIGRPDFNVVYGALGFRF
jgi:opacity protein-like surface antigen